MWFKELTGFTETNGENIRKNLLIDGQTMTSKINQRSFHFGELQIATLQELKQQVIDKGLFAKFSGKIKVTEVVADVAELHADIANKNALFQVASQFNLLEMVSPHIIPEQGVDCYENDHTQGPTCAIACGAGTIYRNYFVPIKSAQGEIIQIGQSHDKQIDCLQLIGKSLDNNNQYFWQMKNGYALLSRDNISQLNQTLSQLSDSQRQALQEQLKVGVQWDSEVIYSPTKHRVSQIYCSALPIAYADAKSEKFARLILEATYEATFYSALLNLEKYGSNVLYLTYIGGGVFGNDMDWILQAAWKSLAKFQHTNLDVRLVSYRYPNTKLAEYLTKFNQPLTNCERLGMSKEDLAKLDDYFEFQRIK